MPKNILFIHEEKKMKYGAHYINDLIIQKLRKKGYHVDTIYPEESVNIFSSSLSGIVNILFFYSLINKREEARHYDIIQGTTYTVFPFLNKKFPVISHFGSTTYGFLKNTPASKKLFKEKEELENIFFKLKEKLSLTERNTSIKSLKDIMEIEKYSAKKSEAVIATSEKVKKELIHMKVPSNKIYVIHNAIEDYWFKSKLNKKVKYTANLVYVGRMGDDPFTIKLKGINRLVYILQKKPKLDKIVIGMCENISKYNEFFYSIPKTYPKLSVDKINLPSILKNHYADIFLNPSRYEGFCLSLVEAMSQGLVPISFSVGVAPEIIKNGKNGYIVHSVDEAIKRINFLENNPEKRKEMAEEAIKTSKLFKSAILIEKFSDLYKKIHKSKNKTFK
jgi:glycosyltransferase involved in cell wall biosynthesis